MQIYPIINPILRWCISSLYLKVQHINIIQIVFDTFKKFKNFVAFDIIEDINLDIKKHQQAAFQGVHQQLCLQHGSGIDFAGAFAFHLFFSAF